VLAPLPYLAQGAGLLGADAYMTNYACNTTYELIENQNFTRTGEPKKARQLLLLPSGRALTAVCGSTVLYVCCLHGPSRDRLGEQTRNMTRYCVCTAD